MCCEMDDYLRWCTNFRVANFPKVGNSFCMKPDSFLQPHCKYNYFWFSEMKPDSRIQKICAVGLILLFTLQAGLGLWLHSALHQHAAKPAVYSKSGLPVLQQGATFSFACTCTDNFLVPFISVTDTEITPPAQAFFTKLVRANYCHVTCEVQHFLPLRAPPVLPV